MNRRNWLMGFFQPTLFANVQAQETFTNKSQTYTVSNNIRTDRPILLFYNGIFMTIGIDYVVKERVIEFTTQTIGDDPVITVVYWAN